MALLIMMMPTRTLTLKSPQPEGIADKESSPEPDRMNQYRNALDDYIKDNVYEGIQNAQRIIGCAVSFDDESAFAYY